MARIKIQWSRTKHNVGQLHLRRNKSVFGDLNFASTRLKQDTAKFIFLTSVINGWYQPEKFVRDKSRDVQLKTLNFHTLKSWPFYVHWNFDTWYCAQKSYYATGLTGTSTIGWSTNGPSGIIIAHVHHSQIMLWPHDSNWLDSGRRTATLLLLSLRYQYLLI